MARLKSDGQINLEGEKVVVRLEVVLLVPAFISVWNVNQIQKSEKQDFHMCKLPIR